MSFDFVDYKKDFPLLMQQDVAYLDSAATAQRPASVLQAEKEFYEQANANPLRGLYELGVEATDRYEAARERVRKFLNARSDAEIIFTRNTTESINLVAYSYALNKKVKRLALKSALSAKAASGDILVVDGLKLDEIKTKTMRDFLNAIEAGKSVVITPEVDQVVVKSARNIPGVLTTPAALLNVYDIVNAQYLVVDQTALAKIEEVYA